MLSLIMRPRGRGSAKWLADFGRRLNDYAEQVRPIWGWLLLAAVVALIGVYVWRWVSCVKMRNRK